MIAIACSPRNRKGVQAMAIAITIIIIGMIISHSITSKSSDESEKKWRADYAERAKQGRAQEHEWVDNFPSSGAVAVSIIVLVVAVLLAAPMLTR
jgi:hypothetical protein